MKGLELFPKELTIAMPGCVSIYLSGSNNVPLPADSKQIVSVSACCNSMITADDILSIIRKSSVLHNMATVIQKLSLSSPALSYRFLPFMSCSSALLFPTYETEPIYHGTETVLSDLVHTLGMQLIHMPGDGNCFFYSVAYSLRAQRDNITQLCPTYFNDVNLNNNY